MSSSSPYGSRRPRQSPWQSSSSSTTNNTTTITKTAKIKVCVLGAADAGKTSLLRRYFHHTFQSTRIPTVGSDFYTTKVTVPLEEQQQQQESNDPPEPKSQPPQETEPMPSTTTASSVPAQKDPIRIHTAPTNHNNNDNTTNPNNKKKNEPSKTQSVVLHMWDTPGRERRQGAADDYTVGQDHIHTIVQAFVGRVDGVVLVYDMTSSTSFTQLRLWHAHWMKTLAEHRQNQQQQQQQQQAAAQEDDPHSVEPSLGDHNNNSHGRSSHDAIPQIPILIVGNKRDQALANQQKQQQKQLQQIAQQQAARKQQQLQQQQWQQRMPHWDHHHRRKQSRKQQPPLPVRDNNSPNKTTPPQQQQQQTQTEQPIPAVPQRDVLGLVDNFRGKDFRYEYRVDHDVLNHSNSNSGSLHNPSPRNSSSHLPPNPNNSSPPFHNNHNNRTKRRPPQRNDPAIISTYSNTAAGMWTQDGSYLDSLLHSEDGSNPDRDMVVLWCMRNGLTHMEVSALEDGGVQEAVQTMLQQVLQARQEFVRQQQQQELEQLPQQGTVEQPPSMVRRNQALDLQQRFGPKNDTCCFGCVPAPFFLARSTKQNAWT